MSIHNGPSFHCHQNKSTMAKKTRLKRRDLKEKERSLGVDHPDTLTAVNNLGLQLFHNDKFGEAERQYQRALEGRERVLGVDHRDTLTSINNLGALLFKQNKFKEAELLYRRSVEGQERVLGVDHLDTRISVNNLGLVLYKQGKFEEAELMFRRVLASTEQIFGMNHPERLDSMTSLASVLHKKKDFFSAESFARRSLEGYVRVIKEHAKNNILTKNDEKFSSVARGSTLLTNILQAQNKMMEARAIKEKYSRRELYMLDVTGCVHYYLCSKWFWLTIIMLIVLVLVLLYRQRFDVVTCTTDDEGRDTLLEDIPWSSDNEL